MLTRLQMKVLKNKKLLLGVTGSIAVYKTVDLARRLAEKGASVHVIMTDASKKFITPLTFEAATRNKVHSDLFEDPMSHIALTRDADLMVIAPATANIIGKFANGIADDLLSASLMASGCKVVLAPAMNWRMYNNPAVQKNLGCLLSAGVLQVGPVKGSLACGENEIGRMAEVPDILEVIKSALSIKDLAGRKIMVTAGPTREYLDPVRFISNRSSGKMGFALASAAHRRGAEVTLIRGPVHLTPFADRIISVETASEMREAVLRDIKDMDAVIMAAAVADFYPLLRQEQKLEKADEFNLKLAKTPDILAELCLLKDRPLLIGFAAETGPNIDRAKEKMTRKGADFIVFNNVLSEGAGFDADTNEITIIEKDNITGFPLMSKDGVADVILDRISQLLKP